MSYATPSEQASASAQSRAPLFEGLSPLPTVTPDQYLKRVQESQSAIFENYGSGPELDAWLKMCVTDLLMYSAKAIGLVVEEARYYPNGVIQCLVVREGDDLFSWNPLTSYADAMRLCIALKLSVDRNDCQCCVTVWRRDSDECIVERFESIEGAVLQSEAEATLYAVVRAAAAVGAL